MIRPAAAALATRPSPLCVLHVATSAPSAAREPERAETRGTRVLHADDRSPLVDARAPGAEGIERAVVVDRTNQIFERARLRPPFALRNFQAFEERAVISFQLGVCCTERRTARRVEVAGD